MRITGRVKVIDQPLIPREPGLIAACTESPDNLYFRRMRLASNIEAGSDINENSVAAAQVTQPLIPREPGLIAACTEPPDNLYFRKMRLASNIEEGSDINENSVAAAQVTIISDKVANLPF
jgi:hypothetical protein